MKYDKKECPVCKKLVGSNNIKKHVQVCNRPTNNKTCPVCNKQFTSRWKSTTCSYSCSNKLFRTGENNGNWKEDVYQTTCFQHHKKECVVCGENKIVAVHHMNEDHSDNRPENLIPLCPTHHQYFHSKYRNEVEQIIRDYTQKWKTNR